MFTLFRAVVVAVALASMIACKGKSASADPTELGADEPEPAAVCAHMEELRARKTPNIAADETCLRRLTGYALYDGSTLWKLRGGCILAATSVEAYTACNSGNHDEWPRPYARATEARIQARIRALPSTTRRDAAP